MSPSRIGSYAIERKIGSGGMGTVYLGRHIETGQLAAVKVLPPALAREPGFVARFQREVESLARLINPHVVRLYESGNDADTFFYAMEYVEGESLTARLKRERRLHWKEAVRIAIQVCAALKAAHDAGIVHRDLKPSNLLIADDGTVKLTDFGVAQLFASTKLTATGGIVGTAEYMSPEQAQGKRVTKKSDLYALGAVLYVMVTGRPPFSGRTTLEVVQKHQYGRFDPPKSYVPEIPPWLDSLICELLEKDPEKRPPDAFVTSRRLQQLLARAEFTEREQTVAMHDEGSYDGSATTVAADAAGPAVVPESGPGPGTLMSSLMRADIEREKHGSWLSRLLDSTWVLVALLGLIILGGVLWYRSRQLTPEERFRQGVALLESDGETEWRRVRDLFFKPLLEEDPDIWQERLAPHMRRIHLYELQDALGLTRKGRRRPTPADEAERLLMLAWHAREAGDSPRAEQILEGLLALLENDPSRQETAELAQQMLDRLRQEAVDQKQRLEFVHHSLQRADELASQNQLTQARRIWSAVVALYSNDPEAAAYVEQARRHLEEQTTAGP